MTAADEKSLILRASLQDYVDKEPRVLACQALDAFEVAIEMIDLILQWDEA